MSRSLKILAIAMGAKVCSAQDATVFGNDWGESTQAPTVVPPEEVACPVMLALGQGSYLQTDLWSFMRTVNVRKKNALMDEGYANEEGGVGTTTQPTALPQGAPTAGEGATQPTPLPADERIGRVSAKFWAWNTEYELYDPTHNNLMATLVNPFAFWDTAQEFYDCQGVKLATILYNYNFWDTIQGKYSNAKVLDKDRNHIASLQQDVTKSENFFGEHQYFLYLTDIAGTPIVSMRHPSQKMNLLAESQELDVAIETLSENAMVPLPANSPEFLTLVFANSLAMQRRFGPAWDAGLALLSLVITCCICCACLCTTQSLKDGADEGMKGAKEEHEKLLGHGEKKDSRDFWNCCSRPGSQRGGAFYSTQKSSSDQAKDSAIEFKTKVEGGLKDAKDKAAKHGH